MTISRDNPFLLSILSKFVSAASKTELLTYLDASPSLSALIETTARNWTLTVSPGQVNDAECNADDKQVQISTAYNASSQSAVQDFVLTLAHELGHGVMANGNGLTPGNVNAPNTAASNWATQSPQKYATYVVYMQEGTAVLTSMLVRQEIRDVLGTSFSAHSSGLGRVSPGGDWVEDVILAAAKAAQASGQPYDYQGTVRQKVADFTLATPPAGPGAETYLQMYEKVYILSKMGIDCPTAKMRSLLSLTSDVSAYVGQNWAASLKDSRAGGNAHWEVSGTDLSPVYFDASGTKRAKQLSTFCATQPKTITQNLPPNAIGYFLANEDGSLSYFNADGSSPTTDASVPEYSDVGQMQLDADSALVVFAGATTEYYFHSGDNAMSIALASTATVAADDALKNRSFSLKKSTDGKTVEIAYSSGEKLSVNCSSGVGPLTISRLGLGSASVDTLFAGITTEAVHFVGTDAPNITGYSDVTNTLQGDTQSNALTGGQLRDVLLGSLGNDTLDGAAGADDMAGGGDNDTYVVDNTGDKTTELADEGYDTVQVHAGALSSGNYTLQANIEKGVLLADAGAATLTGNALDNYLRGNAANNTFIGGGGTDTFEGLGGDDLYFLTENSHALEAVNGGNDTAVVQFSEYTLEDNIENLVVTGGTAGHSLVTAYGNNQDNVLMVFDASTKGELYGRAGNDVLVGAGNRDFLFGDEGDDTLSGAGSGDWLEGGTGTNVLDGGEGDDGLVSAGVGDTLLGGAGDDYLATQGTGAVAHGGLGDDYLENWGSGNTIFGDAGNDSIWDGTGGSTFVWKKGDGNDTVNFAQQSTIFQFDESAEAYDLTAQRDGADLVVTASTGGGATFAGWFTGQNRAQIKTPDGNVWTPTQIDSGFTAGIYNVSYSSGVHDASEFASVASSLMPNLTGLSFYPNSGVVSSGQPNAASFADAWQRGLNGNLHTDPQGRTTYRSAGLYADISVGTNWGADIDGHPGWDTYHYRALFDFDVWQDSSGAYKFAITDAWWVGEHKTTWAENNPDYPDYSSTQTIYKSNTQGAGSWSMSHSSRSVQEVAPPIDSFTLFDSTPIAARSVDSSDLFTASSEHIAIQDPAVGLFGDRDAVVSADQGLLVDWSMFGPLSDTLAAAPSGNSLPEQGTVESTATIGTLRPNFGLHPGFDAWSSAGLSDRTMMLLPQLKAA